jgi:Glycosyltransferase family 87
MLSNFRNDLGRFLREYFVYLMPSVLIVYIVLESYQIDFRPYYIAGKSILLGLDPYINHVNQLPAFYVAVNGEDSLGSGFIYPPFAALLFVPFAQLSYVAGKTAYSAFILVILWLLIFELVKHCQFKVQGAAIALAMTSFPVLASFERGQIDILVCYLTVLSFLLYQQHQKALWPACLLAIACCLKIFPGVALMYYAAKRQWRLVSYTLGFMALLLLAPLPYLGKSTYTSYLQRVFPNLFGPLPSLGPISVHGQKIVNNVVIALEGKGLRADHDFVNGYMNPFLRNLTVSTIAGVIALSLLLYLLRRAPIDQQFFAILNTIHLFNPQTWIMGLVWYLPLFFNTFERANYRGKFILILPLFLPPSTNANGMLAYAIALALAMPRSRNQLTLPDQKRNDSLEY